MEAEHDYDLCDLLDFLLPLFAFSLFLSNVYFEPHIEPDVELLVELQPEIFSTKFVINEKSLKGKSRTSSSLCHNE